MIKFNENYPPIMTAFPAFEYIQKKPVEDRIIALETRLVILHGLVNGKAVTNRLVSVLCDAKASAYEDVSILIEKLVPELFEEEK